MADLTYSDLIAKYPEFTTSDADELVRIATAIDLAEARVATGVLKTSARTTLARLTLAAHFVTMTNRTVKHGGGSGGAISSRTTDAGASVGYSQPSLLQSEAVLSTTNYGIMFIAMMRGGRHRRPLVAS